MAEPDVDDAPKRPTSDGMGGTFQCSLNSQLDVTVADPRRERHATWLHGRPVFDTRPGRH